MLNDHGQPRNRHFNAARNEAKALDTFLGLLQGIVADQQLNEREVVVLHSWLKENQEWLKGDGDGVDLIELTTSILEDGIVTDDELEELLDATKTILQFRLGLPANETQAFNQLAGIVQGIVADQTLRDAEIKYIKAWLDATESLTAKWPGSELRRRIDEALRDGRIDAEERKDLLATLEALIGGGLSDGGAVGMAIRLGMITPGNITFPNHSFCVTGRFVYGTRAICERAISSRGGSIQPRVTQDLNYLVVGTLASEDWAHGTHGRKIEQAIAYRDQGHRVMVIPEEVWVQFLPLCQPSA